MFKRNKKAKKELKKAVADTATAAGRGDGKLSSRFSHASGGIAVHVAATYTSATYTVSGLSPSTEVMHIRDDVAAQAGVDPSRIRLYYHGYALAMRYTLAEKKIKNGATIAMYIGPVLKKLVRMDCRARCALRPPSVCACTVACARAGGARGAAGFFSRSFSR